MVGLSETSIRPLSADFESAGTISALIRTCKAINREFLVPDLPLWIFESRLNDVLGSEMEVGMGERDEVTKQAVQLVGRLAQLEREIIDALESMGICDRKQTEDFDTRTAASADPLPSSVCLARLLMGACCEAFLSLKCSSLVRPGDCVEDTKDRMSISRLYKDGLLVATWTSAHAIYLRDLMNHHIAPCSPSIHSIPNESCEMDFSDLYARRTCPKVLSQCRDSACMLSVMARCTNPGSRGWNSVLSQSLDKSEGVRRICQMACTVSITGMTSRIHPATRLHWKDRLILGVALTNRPSTSVSAFSQACPVEMKEVIRRMVSNCTSSSYATNAALYSVEHPIALLGADPLGLPIAGLQISATALALSGKAFLDSEFRTSLADCVRETFQRELATESKSEAERAPKWNPGYLGTRHSNHTFPFPISHYTNLSERRGARVLAGKGTASVHKKVSAIAVTSEIWSMAFKANFIPFWVHSTSHHVRAYRLNETQHRAIHGLNAATKLVSLLPEEEQLRLQRIALQSPAIGIMTLEEVCELLGISGVRGSSCNGGSKNVQDAVNTIGVAGEMNAARILSICRSASIFDQVLTYDLGPRTARMHATALLKRLLVNEICDIPENGDPFEFLHHVPEHSKCLCVCMECKRVSNAYACDWGFKRQSFDELGTSSSMASVDNCNGKTRLRCSKRSSASMRAAVSLEEEMDIRCIEEDVHHVDVTEKFLVDCNTGLDTGIAARARRDAKIAMEQRASSVSCGAECMVTIPIIGKAIRIWGNWYSLCSLCGCFVRYGPQNRMGTEICCMRCDYRMLNRKEKPPLSAKDAAEVSKPVCRFCGKQDFQKTGAKWKLVRSPHDTSGNNANLPPPLRTVHFCNQHFRSWIPGCLKTMPTRVILSHIVYGARPLPGVLPENGASAEPNKKPIKRRRTK